MEKTGKERSLHLCTVLATRVKMHILSNSRLGNKSIDALVSAMYKKETSMGSKKWMG